MTMLALIPSQPSVTPRVGSPRRGAILTALASAAVRNGNLKAVLTLARTGRPRSLMACSGAVRQLALAGLETVYPEANGAALRSALGFRRAPAAPWPADLALGVAHDIVANEDAQMTGRWIWPHACAVAAEHTGADATTVATVTGSRATPPRVVARARKLAVYLTMTEGDVNLTAMAAATGLDKSTVRFHVEGLGDARDDDAALDALLETLAAALRDRLDLELSQW